MKIKLCKRCESTEVFGRYQYCPACKEVVDAEDKARRKKRSIESYKKKIGGVYKYNKNHGIKPPKKEAQKPSSPASIRWATMSWYDLCKELDYYKLKYRDTQVMAMNDILPENFGLGHKEVHI